MFETIGIVVNSGKPEAYPLAKDLVAWLLDRQKMVLGDAGVAVAVGDALPRGRSVAEVATRSDLIVVFGGDGTLLSVAGHLDGHDAPILGVKMGGLGFLTEIMEDEVRATLEALFAGEHRLTERTMLEATLTQGPHATCGPFTALNDIVFARDSPAKIVTLDAEADGRPLCRFLCDGLIFATPTGSTAHNLAAGGPIIEPSAKVFVLTPISPHTLTLRPFVLEGETEITVRVASADAEVHLVCDGQDVAMLGEGDAVVIRRAQQTIKTVGSLERDYYSILRTKLKWGER